MPVLCRDNTGLPPALVYRTCWAYLFTSRTLGLFGKFCWAPTDNGWVKTPCMHLDEHAARMYCDRIFDYAKKLGGAVTILWHYENLTPPRDWSRLYKDLVKRAQADGAWVTTAGAVVEWFKRRRETGIEYCRGKNIITIKISNRLSGQNPPMFVRAFIDPVRVANIDTEYRVGEDYIDIRCTRPEITVTLL